MTIQRTLKLRTGRDMPALGLGTWQLTHDTAGTVEEALRLGYPMLDTSSDYGTHAGIGEALRRSDVNRDAVFVVTKVEEDEDAYRGARRDLRELGLDYTDLIVIHRPPPTGAGEDLWRGLIRARDDGLTRDIGVSNYSIEQMQALIDATDEVPAVNQIEWSPFGWSLEMLEYCRQHAIVIQGYSPLTRAERLADETLLEIATAYRKTPAQVLIRWSVQLLVAPLPKANRQDHLAENLAVFDFELDDAQMAELNDLNEHWSSLGSGLQYM